MTLRKASSRSKRPLNHRPGRRATTVATASTPTRRAVHGSPASRRHTEPAARRGKARAAPEAASDGRDGDKAVPRLGADRVRAADPILAPRADVLLAGT